MCFLMIWVFYMQRHQLQAWNNVSSPKQTVITMQVGEHLTKFEFLNRFNDVTWPPQQI